MTDYSPTPHQHRYYHTQTKQVYEPDLDATEKMGYDLYKSSWYAFYMCTMCLESTKVEVKERFNRPDDN